MPAKKKTEQQFLVIVQQMMTCDEADMVSGWSAVISKRHMKNFGALRVLPKVLAETIKDAPATNLRPMTLAEIAVWRKEN